MAEENLLAFELVILLLFAASWVSLLVRRFRMPYTVILVFVGLVVAVSPLDRVAALVGTKDALINLLSPEFILMVLVPPLVFEAAFHLRFNELRRDLKNIFLFAIPGVVVTMFMVAGLLYGVGVMGEFSVALLFGALVAATDPIAVVALFRALGVPKRLQILLEGESLFNDGTAIVIFNLMAAIILGTHEASVGVVLWEFVLVSGGGLLVGVTVGWFMLQLIRILEDYLIETTATVVAAYGAYILAESFHASGVLAVVAAGLIIGNISQREMSPTTRISLLNLWEYVAFIVNTLVFLLIGLVIDLQLVWANFNNIILTIIIVLIARAVVIMTFSAINNDVPLRFRYVLIWGGLRGAISLALALSLPNLPGQADVQVQTLTYGVVLFTLVVQGASMRWVVNRLGLAERNPARIEYEYHQARAVAAQNAYNHVKNMGESGLISDHAWELLEGTMRRTKEARAEAVREIMHKDREMEKAELNNAYLEGLRAQRTAYFSLYTSGIISEETYSNLVAEVDSALSFKEIHFGELLLPRGEDASPISKLIVAAVAENDLRETVQMMNILGVPTTKLDTERDEGGQFVTLLMGVEAGQVEEVIGAIVSSCHQTAQTELEVVGILAAGGPIEQRQTNAASNLLVYTIDIERYEEF